MEVAMSDISVRIATLDDASSVADIVRDGWNDIYAGYRAQLGDGIYDSVYDTDPLLAKAERLKGAICEGRVFVAVCDGKICGFASFAKEGNIGVLKDNAVAPCARGKGVSSLLYSAVFDKLRALGCNVVRVGTGLDDAHAPARRAYEKVGFEVGLPSITYYKKL